MSQLPHPLAKESPGYVRIEVERPYEIQYEVLAQHRSLTGVVQKFPVCVGQAGLNGFQNGVHAFTFLGKRDLRKFSSARAAAFCSFVFAKG